MAELGREGRPFAVATVVRTIGSTPQVVGAKMLVDDLGRTFGTLGGGCVEGDAFAEAKRVIDEGGASLREYELTEDLAWDTGLVCGGTMWIHIEPGAGALTVGDRDLLADVLAASSTGTPIALATLLRKAGRDIVPSGRLYVEQSGASGGTLGDADLDARARAIAAEALKAGTARTAPLEARPERERETGHQEHRDDQGRGRSCDEGCGAPERDPRMSLRYPPGREGEDGGGGERVQGDHEGCVSVGAAAHAVQRGRSPDGEVGVVGAPPQGVPESIAVVIGDREGQQ